MPKRIIPLSDMKVQKAKSKENKPVTLFDGGRFIHYGYTYWWKAMAF